MTTFFIVLSLIGGALLALQLLLGLFGLAHDLELPGLGHLDAHDHDGDAHAGEALNLLSFRALTAGVLFCGLSGWAMERASLGLLALPVALAAGLAAATAVGWAMRAVKRMESDGAERLEQAVGLTGTVYLGIPGARAGSGKVHLTLAGRLVECRAQAELPLPTGAAVLVVDVVGPDLVEVIPSPSLGA